jgi:hypothetical protein
MPTTTKQASQQKVELLRKEIVAIMSPHSVREPLHGGAICESAATPYQGPQQPSPPLTASSPHAVPPTASATVPIAATIPFCACI